MVPPFGSLKWELRLTVILTTTHVASRPWHHLNNEGDMGKVFLMRCGCVAATIVLFLGYLPVSAQEGHACLPLGPHAAHGLEQLGFLRHNHYRGGI